MTISVAQAFGRKGRQVFAEGPSIMWPDHKQLIGIEIELERALGVGSDDYQECVLQSGNLSYWQTTSDGSLINGIEYRLVSPLHGDALSHAIHEFFRPPTKIYRSVTSGTHIHINMDEDSTPLSAVQSLSLLVFAIEPAIYAIVDPGRKWSGFTNPLDAAPGELLQPLFTPGLMDKPQKFLRLCGKNHAFKYHGLNVQTLGSYGSLEFRYFPTATNPEELVSWVSMVQSLKLAAMANPTMEAMEHVLSDEETYLSLLNAYLAPWADRIAQVVPAKVAKRRVIRAKTHSLLSVKADEGSLHIGNIQPGKLHTKKKWDKFFKKKPSAAEYFGDEELAPYQDPSESVAPIVGGRIHVGTIPASPDENDLLVSRTMNGSLKLYMHNTRGQLPSRGWNLLATFVRNGENAETTTVTVQPSREMMARGGHARAALARRPASSYALALATEWNRGNQVWTGRTNPRMRDAIVTFLIAPRSDTFTL